jgi:hypothetical protein
MNAEPSHKYGPVDTPEYKHNHEHSLFHQLPADLMPQMIDEISKHADALFALRLVCRDFHTLFQAPFIIGPDERESFKAGLRRDDAIWYPRYERLKGLDNLPKAICSACRVQHPKSQFSPEELAKDPECRICVGAQNSFRLATDCDITFNNIRDLGPDESKAGFQKAFVSKCIIRKPDIYLRGPVMDTIIAHTFRHRELQTLRQIRLMSLSESSGIPFETLLQCLIAVGEYVCGLFDAISICVEGGQAGIRSKYQPPTPLWKDCDSIYESFGKRWVPCMCSDKRGGNCVHLYSLWRRHSRIHPGFDDVILSFSRTYRPEIDAADPRWATDVVRELVEQQMKMNRGAGADGETTVFQASGRGDWTWDEASTWVRETGVKSSGWGEEDGRSLQERLAELKLKRKERGLKLGK